MISSLHPVQRTLGAIAAAGAALLVFTAAKPEANAIRPGAYRAVRPGPNDSSPYPFQNGFSFAYARTETVTIAYPSATPIVTSTSDPYVLLESCPVTFNGVSNLCANQLSWANYPNEFYDDYEGYVPLGSLTDYAIFGATLASVDGAYTTAESYTYSPYEIFLQFPEAAGHRFDAYDNVYKDSRTTYGPKGYLSTETVNEDKMGAYKEVLQTTAHHAKTNETLIVNRDASGAFKLAQPGYNALTRTFGVPQNVGGQEVIPVTSAGGNPTPATPSPPTTVYVPDWFPGGGAPPKRLADLPENDRGAVALPASCGAYAGTQAEDFQGTISVLDPVEGVAQAGQLDQYQVDGVGNVCDIFNVATNVYDNLASGALLYTETEVHNVVLLSESQGQARRYGPILNGPTSKRKLNTTTFGRWRDPLRLLRNRLAMLRMHSK